MKKIIILCGALAVSTLAMAQDLPVMSYEIDISQNLDTFFVTLSPATTLDKSARIYQFAATAPGTYQTMNLGRFVSAFRAFDKKGRELLVTRKSVNQFEISKPHKIAKITYQMAETFDTPVEDFPVYLMCGSSIEEDHALINTHTIMGYFEGYQKSPISISVTGKDDWKIGTALPMEGNRFLASSFDHAVDSPILMGELSFADTTIADTQVEIYTYSQQGNFDSKSLLAGMSDMLDATLQFLVELPVDRYTFLYFFEPGLTGATGAWEHSYSSEYVLEEKDPTPEYMQSVTDIASHEFFHIVTPLNIHSEIVESFNFVSPTPSVHLWMYEGVTEWASNMLLYRGGVVEEEDYLQNAIATKILVDEKYFDPTWSLKKLSDESFNGGAASKQYANIYFRGSLVAGLLDIRLLELSGGQAGLRELMLKLIDQYGKGKPVSEKTFFDDLTAMTYPEIGDFFDQYILAANPLPHEEYLAKIGLELTRGESGISVTKMKEMSEDQRKLFEAWSKNL